MLDFYNENVRPSWLLIIVDIWRKIFLVIVSKTCLTWSLAFKSLNWLSSQKNKNISINYSKIKGHHCLAKTRWKSKQIVPSLGRMLFGTEKYTFENNCSKLCSYTMWSPIYFYNYTSRNISETENYLTKTLKNSHCTFSHC